MNKHDIGIQPFNKIYHNDYFIKNFHDSYYSILLKEILSFSDKVSNPLKLLEENGIEVNEKYYDYIIELNELASNNLHVNNSHDFNKAMSVIRSSELLINRSFINQDLECLSVGLFGLGFILDDLGIFG